MDTGNIFQKSEQLIQEYALPKNSLTRAWYSCFDSFNNTQRKLLVWERALCLEFQRLVEEYKIDTKEILEFIDKVNYEALFVKNSCYISLDNYGLSQVYSKLKMIESWGYSGVLTVKTAYHKKDNDIEYKLEIPNELGVRLNKSLDIHNNSFTFYFDGENSSDMYSFVTQICEELQDNHDIPKCDHAQVSEFVCEFIPSIQANTEIITKLYYYFQKFWVDEYMLDALSDWNVNDIQMEVIIDGKEDKWNDIVEFSWNKDCLEILKYIEDLELHYWSLTLEITQVLDY